MASILIVDDDTDLAELISEVLTARGHQIRCGSDGAEGLRLLDEEIPDLLVLDVEMPELSGPDVVLRMIVHNAGMERVPILLISGIVDFAALAERVGTPYFLAKPFDPYDFLAMVERALRERLPLSSGPA